MKKLLLLFVASSVLPVTAQVTSYFDFNENAITCTINSNGALFTDYGSFNAGFSLTENILKSTIFESRFSFGGITSNGNLALSRTEYANDFASGPLSVDNSTYTDTTEAYGSAQITLSQSYDYSQIFVVTKAEVDEFLAYRACLENPNCDETVNFPGYTVPSSIENWPAHGNISLDEPYYLAPFSDVNNDGAYDPNDGDFPCIKGDVYAWLVVNDVLVDQSIMSSFPGAELQIEVYQYTEDYPNDPKANTVFVGVDLINRSTNSYFDFYFSNYTDFDIGFTQDDYFGSLENYNAYFGYNGDVFDESQGGYIGFQDELPAQGVVCLNQDLYAVGKINATNTSNIQYYQVMQGNNLDGSVKVFPGTTVPTRYSFPYESTTPFNWTESDNDGNGNANIPGERRAQGSFGPYNFLPGTVLEFDFAYVYSNLNSAAEGNEGSITKLISDIQTIQDFYDNMATNCSGGFLDVEEEEEISLNVYPNPTKDILNVENSDGAEMTLSLYNLQGQLILEQSINGDGHINISELQNGAYLLLVESDDKVSLSRKILKY